MRSQVLPPFWFNFLNAFLSINLIGILMTNAIHRPIVNGVSTPRNIPIHENIAPSRGSVTKSRMDTKMINNIFSTVFLSRFIILRICSG